MKIEALLSQLQSSPETVEFSEVMETINENYHYTPTPFTNGIGEHKVVNEAGQNEGSCRIFFFAKLQELSKEQTLACFGKNYRDEVLPFPLGRNHANIRAFIQYGWMGIHFDGVALKSRYN